MGDLSPFADLDVWALALEHAELKQKVTKQAETIDALCINQEQLYATVSQLIQQQQTINDFTVKGVTELKHVQPGLESLIDAFTQSLAHFFGPRSTYTARTDQSETYKRKRHSPTKTPPKPPLTFFDDPISSSSGLELDY